MKFRAEENRGDRKIKREKKKNVRGREVEWGRKTRSRGIEVERNNNN